MYKWYPPTNLAEKPQIDGKRGFYELYNRERFGNKPHSWYYGEEPFIYPGAYGVGIRTTTKANALFICPVAYENMDEACKDIVVRNLAAARDIHLSTYQPNESAKILTEVRRDITGLDLKYTFDNHVNMRALSHNNNGQIAKIEFARGLRAFSLLKYFMDPASWEDMWEIFDDFPNAVIELGVYEPCFGIYPNRNTMFWEVRDGH